MLVLDSAPRQHVHILHLTYFYLLSDLMCSVQCVLHMSLDFVGGAPGGFWFCSHISQIENLSVCPTQSFGERVVGYSSI